MCGGTLVGDLSKYETRHVQAHTTMRKHGHAHARPGATAIDTTHGDTTLHRRYHHNAPPHPPSNRPIPHGSPTRHEKRRHVCVRHEAESAKDFGADVVRPIRIHRWSSPVHGEDLEASLRSLRHEDTQSSCCFYGLCPRVTTVVPLEPLVSAKYAHRVCRVYHSGGHGGHSERDGLH